MVERKGHLEGAEQGQDWLRRRLARESYREPRCCCCCSEKAKLKETACDYLMGR